MLAARTYENNSSIIQKNFRQPVQEYWQAEIEKRQYRQLKNFLRYM